MPSTCHLGSQICTNSNSITRVRVRLSKAFWFRRTFSLQLSRSAFHRSVRKENMLECGQGKHVSGTMIDASGRTSGISSEEAKILTYKLVRVENDGSFIPASEDEVTDVEHLLAEPDEKGLMDGVLGFEAESTYKSLAIERFQCPGGYGQLNSDNGPLFSSTVQGGGRPESKYEHLDGMLQGVDEGELHSACDDYLLDAELSEKFPNYDCGPCGGSHLRNIGPHSHSKISLNEDGRDAVGISKLLRPSVSLPESCSGQNLVSLDKMTMRELQQAFRSVFGRETTVKDKHWLKRRITFGLQNLVELDSAPCFLDSGLSSNGSEGNLNVTSSDGLPGTIYHSITKAHEFKTKLVNQGLERERFSSKDATTTSYSAIGAGQYEPSKKEDGEGLLEKEKRLRKPTRRYIEESSDLKTRSCCGRLPVAIKGDKLMQARSQNRHHRKGFGATTVMYRQDSFKGSGIQVPFGLHAEKGSKKNTTMSERHYLEDDNEDVEHSSESQDDMSDDSVERTKSEKGESRRKHHRLWNLSEVVKLIDGVSQYGVGHWTEIKRLLFSTSAHRTSVDLKDKWRNLLRASGAQLHNKRKVEQGRKQATRPIPLSLLRRVSELAIIHPYPRERKSKMPRTTHVVIHKALTAYNDPSISRSGRLINRKNQK